MSTPKSGPSSTSASETVRAILRRYPGQAPTPWHAGANLFLEDNHRACWVDGAVVIPDPFDEGFLKPGVAMHMENPVEEGDFLNLPEDFLKDRQVGREARMWCRGFVEANMDALVPDNGRINFSRRLFGFTIGDRGMENTRSNCLALTVPENVRADWARILVRFVDEALVFLNETHGCAPGWPKTEKDAERYWPDDARALKNSLLVNQKIARERVNADGIDAKTPGERGKISKP